MTAAERQRLARILGMLGSEHAGERASAGLQAEAFRKRHGLTWEEMIQGKTVYLGGAPPWAKPDPDPAMAAQQARWAAEDAARKARWAAPEPPPPRPAPRLERKQQPAPPPNPVNLNIFTVAVLIGTPVLLRILGFMPPHWGLPH
jgi:hypothetical protein